MDLLGGGKTASVEKEKFQYSLYKTKRTFIKLYSKRCCRDQICLKTFWTNKCWGKSYEISFYEMLSQVISLVSITFTFLFYHFYSQFPSFPWMQRTHKIAKSTPGRNSKARFGPQFTKSIVKWLHDLSGDFLFQERFTMARVQTRGCFTVQRTKLLVCRTKLALKLMDPKSPPQLSSLDGLMSKSFHW